MSQKENYIEKADSGREHQNQHPVFCLVSDTK